MPKKKSQDSSSKPVTQEFLTKFVTEQTSTIIQFVKDQRRFIETRIDFVRNDAKEQIQSVSVGLHRKMEEMDKKIDQVEKNLREDIHCTQLAVREVKSETLEISKRLDHIETKLDAVVEKVEQHDEAITFLKAAVVKA